MNPIFIRITKIFVIILFSIIGYFIIVSSLSFLIPVCLAVMIAFLIEPGVLFLETKLKVPRPAASIAAYGLLTFLVFVLLGLILTEIYHGIAYLAELIPEQLQTISLIIGHYFQTSVLPLYEIFFSFFNELTEANQTMIQNNLNELFNSIALLFGSFFESLLFSIPQMLAFVPESLTVILFIFLASILLSADFPRVKREAIKYIPGQAIIKLKAIFRYLKETAIGFMRAQAILVSVSFFIILLGLIILKIKHALTIALFMLFIDLIPFVGTGLFFIPWIIYCFLTANYPLTIGLAVLYIIVILVRQLIEPKVLAMSINIHPLTWLIAVFAGYKFFGVLGLALAPIIIILTKSLYETGVFHSLIRFINSGDKK